MLVCIPKTLFLGAKEGTRTPKPVRRWNLNQCVYQFPHLRGDDKTAPQHACHSYSKPSYTVSPRS